MLHHHHSPAVRALGSLAWVLAAVGAVAWGLIGLGAYLGKSWNIWEAGFIMNNLSWLVVPAQMLIGLAGLVSLLVWAKCLGHCHDDHKKH